WLSRMDGGSIRPAVLKSLRWLGRRDRERISAAIGVLPEGEVKLLRGAAPVAAARRRVGG
ncbi:MAG TPA: hypothetical protein VG147_00700, partial [Solirubrobacteraceae bacterium]|nr:hypothetical protein [Solirubrobacteraceae bacterium]